MGFLQIFMIPRPDQSDHSICYNTDLRSYYCSLAKDGQLSYNSPSPPHPHPQILPCNGWKCSLIAQAL